MGTKDKRVDAYIAKSAQFAQPILLHLRDLVHKTCPGVEETMKWGFPHFDYHGIFCSMAAFKHHCAFGFWKASLMKKSEAMFSQAGNSAMGDLGQVKSLSDLPSDKQLIAGIKEAMKLNKEGVKITRRKPVSKKEPVIPDYFVAALRKNKKASASFDRFSDSNRREYVEWVMEAKTEETRLSRLSTAIEWISEGKVRNWKYIRK